MVVGLERKASVALAGLRRRRQGYDGAMGALGPGRYRRSVSGRSCRYSRAGLRGGLLRFSGDVSNLSKDGVSFVDQCLLVNYTSGSLLIYHCK